MRIRATIARLLYAAADSVAGRMRRTAADAISARPVDGPAAQRFEVSPAFSEHSLSHSMEAKFWIAHDRRILYANDAACLYLGYSCDELQAMTLDDFSDGPPMEYGWTGTWDRLKRGERLRLYTRHRTKAGDSVPVRVVASMMLHQDEEFIFAVVQDLTDASARERALEESRRRFETVLEMSNQAILVHRGFRLLYVNPAFARMHGYDNVREAMEVGTRETTIAPHELERLRAYNQARLSGAPAPGDYVYEGRRKDGSSIWVNNRTFLIDWGGEPATCATLFDVTAARAAMHQLHLTEFALDNASIAIFGITPEGRFAFANDAAGRYLGYSRDELLSLSVMDIARISPAIWQTRWQEIESRTHLTFETIHVRKDGKLIPVEVSANFLAYEDQEYCYAFVKDITERKAAETALRQAHDELERRVEERTRALSHEVEERRRAETAVIKSESRLRGALESLQEGFALYDADDRLVLMNAKYAQINPSALDVLQKGGTFEDLVRTNLHSGRLRLQPGEDGETYIRERLAQRDKPGTPTICEFSNDRWYLVLESRTAEGGIALTATDITDLKVAERDLAHKQQQFDIAMAAMTDGLSVIDKDMHYAAFNDKVYEFYDIPRDVARVGGPVIDVYRFMAKRGDFGAGDPEELAQRELAVTGGSKHQVVQRRPPNGRVIEVRRSRLPAGGFVSVFSDVSHRIRFEEGLRIARDRAEEANKAKSAFLANISHEIRTPMNGILGVADILKDTTMTAEQRNMVDIIADSTRTLVKIIDDLLDFSKIEAGRLELDSTTFSLCHLVSGAAELMTPRAEDKNTEIGVFVDPAIPDSLIGDPVRIRQILLNLIGNAVKFTDDGRVDVEVTRVEGRENKETILFEIRDSGIGINPDLKDKLFQPFEQGDSSTVRRFGGTGLGLSISKALVDLLGGEIGAENRADGEVGGAKFWFRVSLERSARQQTELEAQLRIRARSAGKVGLFTRNAATVGILRRYFAHLGFPTNELAGQPPLDALSDGPAARLGGAFDEAESHLGLLVLDYDENPERIRRFLGHRSSIDADGAAPIIVLASRHQIATFGRDPLPGAPIVLSKPISRIALYQAAASALGLPIPRPASPDEPAALAPFYTAPDEVRAEAEGTLILCAEDNPVNRDVLKMMVTRLGFAVDMVTDGAAAWTRLGERSYGLLITDCHMPEMDGFDLARKIREEENRLDGQRLPIIALTADALAEARERCLSAGMDDFVLKPVNRARLNEAIARLLPKALELRRPVENAEPDRALNTQPIAIDEGVLDLKHIYEAVGGDEARVPQLLDDYLRNARGLAAELLAAVARSEFERAREVAHAAKGSSRFAGAMRFADLCEDIEALLLIGKVGNVQELCRRIEPELAIVDHAINMYERRAASQERH